VSWTVNTQSAAGDAEDALTAAFEQGYADVDDGSREQFDLAVKAVEQFLKSEDESDWFQFSISGHALGESPAEGERPHISIGVTPVAKPYGV
jgi:hypothetical protein